MEKKEEKEWKSCCLRADKKAVLFASQFIISLLILSFAMRQISIDPSDQNYSRYGPIISMIIGVFFPNPTIH
jgi:hypothetical protein